MARGHLIETALLDITFASEEAAFKQQPELGDFFKRDLMPVVDELFNESAEFDRVLCIETLEVDLGVVNYSEYRDELPKRLREELRTILAGMKTAKQRQDRSATGAELITTRNSEQQQIEYFLFHGHLTWYSTLQGERLEAALIQLLATNSVWFQHFIASSPSSATIISRVVWQFSTTVPMVIVEQLGPTHVATATVLINDLKSFWSGRYFVSARPAIRQGDLVKRFWYRVIEALLGAERLLSTQRFFERIVSDLLQLDLGLQHDQLAELVDATEANTPAEGHRLNVFLRHLLESSTVASATKKNQEVAQDDVVTDEALLREAVIQALVGGSVDQLTRIWPQLINEKAPLFKTLLQHYGQQSSIRHRIAFDFADTTVRDIVQVIEPKENGFVTAIVDQVELSSKSNTIARKQLWEFSLGYLLVERGSRFNRKSYLSSMVRQMAAHENISQQQLLTDLSHNVSTFTGSNLVVRQMQQLLLELGHELTKSNGDRAAVDDSVLDACDDLDLLRSHFKNGASGRVDEPQLTKAIGRLSQRHPWLLLQLYRQLQAGLPAWQSAINGFSAQFLQQFVIAFISLTQVQDMTGRSDLLDAIKANAARSSNLRNYYRQLLATLLTGEMIDFDAIILKSSVVSDEPDISAEQRGGKQVMEAGSDIRTADEIDATLLKQYLLTDTELPVQTLAALVKHFENIARHQPHSLSLLLGELLQNRTAITRLIHLLPERLLARCLPLMKMNEYDRMLQCADVLTSACYLNKLTSNLSLLPRLKWRFIFAYLAEAGACFSERDFVQRYVAYLMEQTRQSDQQTFRSQLSQQLLHNILPSTRDATRRIIEAVANSSAPQQPRVTPVEQREPAAASTSPKEQDEQSDQPPQENIYIANAGLVLATPYLPRLFQMLGLTENARFVNRDAAVRATHMLQYLVNGQSASPEYLLPLNKLLCGIKSGHPIELSIEIMPDEKSTLEGLLQGMIQNWRALGNTSVAGLRESFLQREGRLQLKDDAWHLLVEPRSFDMLLDQVPWGYSTIKYPWMERVIYVEWR